MCSSTSDGLIHIFNEHGLELHSAWDSTKKKDKDDDLPHPGCYCYC